MTERTPAQRRMVRHAQAEAEQADDGAEQPLSLTIREAEHGPYRIRPAGTAWHF